MAAGARLGVIAPAFAADPDRLDAGIETLRGAGYVLTRRDDVLAREGYLAGCDERRAGEFMGFVDDREVSGMVCVRGGYGCHRIVRHLDATRVREARKPLVGFSDVTTLLLWQRRVAGLVGFHGPVLEREEPLGPEEVASLVGALAGERPPPLRGEGQGGGRAEGRLVGGSLTLLAASLGTPWEVDTRGAILLFEEIGERPYALDRLLQQLACSGKLDAAVGFGVGHLVGCTDPKRDAPTAEQVVLEILGGYDVPLVTGLPFGHRRPNLTWPVGVRGAIDADRGEVQVLESGVVR